jgi:hypothetical protein
MDQRNSSDILGIVPGGRVVGFALLNNAGLQQFGVKSLRGDKTGTSKVIIVNRLFCKLMSAKPRVIITLKLSPQKSTSFNLQQITFIRGLAHSHNCPLYLLSLKQIKTVLGAEAPLKNQRQLAQALASRYHELAHYLPDPECPVINDREKYYQPLFAAVGLAAAYLKIIRDDNQANS